jgi:hypothetical protein
LKPSTINVMGAVDVGTEGLCEIVSTCAIALFAAMRTNAVNSVRIHLRAVIWPSDLLNSTLEHIEPNDSLKATDTAIGVDVNRLAQRKGKLRAGNVIAVLRIANDGIVDAIVGAWARAAATVGVCAVDFKEERVHA